MYSRQKVAIVYQNQAPPEKNGILKPMKPGGYSDSGADIAFSLKRQEIPIVTPVAAPQTEIDSDWVFPDTESGIRSALNQGAEIIWLNTVLYKGHPIEEFINQGLCVVGQSPENVDLYDDKLATNRLLKNNLLPIPRSITITKNDSVQDITDLPFPVVVKPVRGRGSQGVFLATNEEELHHITMKMFISNDFGDVFYLEEFLSGEELTITVMPPGVYEIEENVQISRYWSLPPVRRFNHENGIAPYNGTVAVINNSEVLEDDRIASSAIQTLCHQCEAAAALVEAKAPIRIDCRADAEGKYYLFDLNMKPNMTGASRPHRLDQDSLTALSARKIGWSFDDLTRNMLLQNWKK